MAEVEHWNVDRDGPLSEGAMRRVLEARGYSVTRYIYPSGTCFPEHTHAVDKIDAVLTGRFRMVMAAAAVVLAAGDCLVVPRGVVHSAEVIGDDSVISLDAIKR